MNIEIITPKGITIALLASDDIEIQNTQDALDLMMNCRYQGADCIILHERNLLPEFFDLSSKMAGDILQKFSTYDARLAIVGNFEEVPSKSLKDFIHESNKVGRINFVNSLEEAKEVFSG